MNVETMVPWVASEILEKEKVQACEDVGEAFKRDVDQVEMDLEIIILMIEDQENVVLVVPLPEQENANDDVEPHAHIDGGDIAMNFTYYNYYPTHPFKWKGWVGILFCQIFYYNTFFNCGP